jgi:hypothetical protein
MKGETAMQEIEKLKGELMKQYYPNFLDLRTGLSERANYQVHLFPSEVDQKQAEQSSRNIVVSYTVA